jgi:class 3 adenylate cyclase
LILSAELNRWFLHRAGEQGLTDGQLKYLTEAFEQSRGGTDFAATFGNRNVHAAVGFIDLAGFSDRVKGLAPAEVAAYLLPFLDSLSTTVIELGGLVDKTIGDEVMLVLPNREQEGGPGFMVEVDRLLGVLWNLRGRMLTDYPFRMGLAIGLVHVAQVKAAGYSEWSVFGETVNLAKRLMEVAKAPAFAERRCGGALGVLTQDGRVVGFYERTVRAWPALGPAPDQLVLEEVQDPPALRGISPYRCAVMVPRPPTAPPGSAQERPASGE